MKVKKRNGAVEEVHFEKIHKRLQSLAKGLNVETAEITKKAIDRMYDGISSREIDDHLSKMTMNHSVHYHYNILAGRVMVSSLHKETAIDQLLEDEKERLAKMMKDKKLDESNKLIVKLKNSFFEDPKREDILSRYLSEKKVSDKEIDHLCQAPRFYYVVRTMHKEGILSDELLATTEKFRDQIESKIDYSRDFEFDAFGFSTIAKAYLLQKYTTKEELIDQEIENEDGTKSFRQKRVLKQKSEIVERPQDMFMRVALGIIPNDIDRALRLYELMSKGYYTHATPTLFNAGTRRPQMSSCFLLANTNDSIEGLFKTFAEEAEISKNSGGIGVWYHNVRSAGSHVKGTNGTSAGIVPFLKIKEALARAIDQGGKRKGSVAVYLEPWHADVKEFIQLRMPTGSEENRARDLFIALWCPKLFFKRVEEGGKWSLFNPHTAPDLHNRVGDDFVKLYEQYEAEGRAIEVLDAREFFKDIMQCLIESGAPYILNKDECNLKSNQQNLGVIKSSNLCTEIVQYSNETESAVCNLASICLPKFVDLDKEGKPFFNHKKLHEVAFEATFNADAVIDRNYYVNEKTRLSNSRHRPIGLGVQGLADVFFKMKLPYTSDAARQLNEDIFETIYHAAMSCSVEMAKEKGHYPSMLENGGAPISKGILQFDMWGVQPKSGRYNWEKLREEIKKHGVRNSLLVAPMPTASTSQIFGNTESFEPLTENLYKRKTLSGEFLVVNKYMIQQLEELNLWGSDVENYLKTHNGSILNMEKIPKEVREVYRTVWEISLRKQLDMAAERGAYVCQSQSFNIHMEKPSMERMKDVYMYAYKLGLKTMSYYFRTQAATTNQKVTTDRSVATTQTTTNSAAKTEDDDCLVCGS